MTDDNNLLEKLDRLGSAALGQPPLHGPVATGGDDATVNVYLDDARAVRAVDALPEGETRLLGVKRSIMRAGQLFLHRQARYNHSVLEAVTLLNSQLAHLRARMSAEFARTGAALAQLDAALDDLEQRVAELERSGGPAVHEIVESQTALRGSLNALSADIERVVSDIRTVTPPSISESSLDAIALRGRTRAESFYERFEDAMRGSAESVKGRLEPYLADLDARRSIGGSILDVGCGRGEWLELVQEHGFDALGIDFNGEAVTRCTARGLKAIQGDAIAYLRDTEAASLLAVTGFHIVEHLPPNVQIELVEAAWRALRPGGLLILETPNPTNLNVGAASFYSDPSHLRPVDPDYLYYLYGDVGFVGVEVRYLNPREDYEPLGGGTTDIEDEMMRALRGPRDFSVIGRKPGVATATP